MIGEALEGLLQDPGGFAVTLVLIELADPAAHVGIVGLRERLLRPGHGRQDRSQEHDRKEGSYTRTHRNLQVLDSTNPACPMESSHNRLRRNEISRQPANALARAARIA
jgi:hypothetical protein